MVGARGGEEGRGERVLVRKVKRAPRGRAAVDAQHWECT